MALTYRLEIIDTEGSIFTIIGGPPVKEAYEDFTGPEQFEVMPVLSIPGITGQLAIRKEKIKAMNLEKLQS